MTSEVYKIISDIALDYFKDLINIKKSKLQFQERKSGKSRARYGLRSFRYEVESGSVSRTI